MECRRRERPACRPLGGFFWLELGTVWSNVASPLPVNDLSPDAAFSWSAKFWMI